jgi:hypothetical protein
MSSEDDGQRFWTSMSGILTALVVLLTAGACLLFVLVQAGVFGDDSSGTASPAADAPTSSSAATSPSATTPQSSSTVSPSQSPGLGSQDPGATLAGTWSGRAASADGDFDVVLTIEPTCALRKPCGSIHVSSAPCTGRVRLWTIEDTTYEFYVDRFSEDSSPDCTAGPGEFFERVDDDHLRYTTDYSDAVGLLQRG